MTWRHGAHYDSNPGQLGDHAAAVSGPVGIMAFAAILTVIAFSFQLLRADVRIWCARTDS